MSNSEGFSFNAELNEKGTISIPEEIVQRLNERKTSFIKVTLHPENREFDDLLVNISTTQGIPESAAIKFLNSRGGFTNEKE